MLKLASERTDGAHPYFVPVEHTAFARERLGDGPLLAPELAVVIAADRATAREAAQGYLDTYLALENYTNNLRRFGFGEGDIEGGGSDRLLDALVAWGDAQAIQARVAEHLAAGAALCPASSRCRPASSSSSSCGSWLLALLEL